LTLNIFDDLIQRLTQGNQTQTADQTASQNETAVVSPEQNPNQNAPQNETAVVTAEQNPQQSAPQNETAVVSPTQNPQQSAPQNETAVVTAEQNPQQSAPQNETAVVTAEQNPQQSAPQNETAVVSPTQNPQLSAPQNETSVVSPTQNPSLSGTQSSAQSAPQNATQNPQQNPQQNQTNTQTETQFPIMGDQTVNQNISAPVDVNGVTVSVPVSVPVTLNVKCGDCEPENHHPHCKNKGNDCNCEGSCEKLERKKNNCNCGQDCGDCSQCLCDLLEKVLAFQTTIINPLDKQVDVYLTSTTPLGNTIVDQVITDVSNCCIVRLKPGFPPTPTPAPTLPPPGINSTTVQLCDVAGISALNTGTTPSIFQFLLNQAFAVEEQNDQCCKCHESKKKCNCPRCASVMGEELACTAKFGISVIVSIKGLMIPLPSLFVYKVKDCLVYLVDNLNTPTEICFFIMFCSRIYSTITNDITDLKKRLKSKISWVDCLNKQKVKRNDRKASKNLFDVLFDVVNTSLFFHNNRFTIYDHFHSLIKYFGD
jgi:hypothetical protein